MCAIYLNIDDGTNIRMTGILSDDGHFLFSLLFQQHAWQARRWTKPCKWFGFYFLSFHLLPSPPLLLSCTPNAFNVIKEELHLFSHRKCTDRIKRWNWLHRFDDVEKSSRIQATASWLEVGYIHLLMKALPLEWWRSTIELSEILKLGSSALIRGRTYTVEETI